MKNEDYYIGKGKLYLNENKEIKLKWYQWVFIAFFVFWIIAKNRFSLKRTKQALYVMGLKETKKMNDEFILGKYYNKN